MKKIICHQYTTGRGTSGYGFVAYSKKDPQKQEATYSFSPNKAVGLRFSQLPAGMDYVFEVEPASADYRHAGAFITRNREEGGSSSLYTHVLMTKERPTGAEALGLLKVENFLTPEEFSEVTHSALNLEITEKDCDLPYVDFIPLNPEQINRLGEFLARYWALMEQKEWSGKGNPELALQLSGMNQTEMIAFFAREVVPCLPEYVRPAVSASFGANWNNRGSSPCVCCVLSDNSESPFPCYNPSVDGINFARPAGPVEQEVGRILVQKNTSNYPETYLRIEKFARNNEACANMARGFSVMAYCVQARMANGSITEMRKAYNALVTLAEKRYGIRGNTVSYLFLPLIQDIFNQYGKRNVFNAEDIAWMLERNIELHRSDAKTKEREALDKNDELLLQGFSALKLDQMKDILSSQWEELKQAGLQPSEIYQLLQKAEETLLKKHMEEGSARQAKSAVEQCVRLDLEAGNETKALTGQYQQWLCAEDNSAEMLKAVQTSDSVLARDEQLYFSLLEQIRNQPERKDETWIVNYLKAVKRGGKKDPERAEKLTREAYQSILSGASRLKSVSTDSFQVIAETVLTQKQKKDTIGHVIDFALQNAQQSDAPGFLKKAAAKMVDSDETENAEYQKILFEKLEQASEAGGQFRADDAIRRLLEKTNNVVRSDKTLRICEKVKHERLTEFIGQFFREAGINAEEDPGRTWDRLFARKCSVVWSELKAEDMADALGNRFADQYDKSDDQAALLISSWNQALQENQKEYGRALQSTVIRKLETDYDPLWQKGDEIQRKALDDLVQSCSMTEQGSDIREICGRTTAGKAKEFLGRLQELSKTGMNSNPEKAGELINLMRDEKGYKQCFQVDYQMEHKQDDDLYNLVITLLQQIQKSPEGNGYWKEPLAELGFDPSIPVWSENGFRMQNILAYVLNSLKNMKRSEMGDDLREYLGDEYMKQLWKGSKADERWFQGSGSSVFSESLYQWMND